MTVDTTLTKDERTRLRAKVRSRLMRVSKRVSAQVARAKASAKREGRRAQSVATPDFSKVLHQQLNGIGRGMARGAGAVDAGEALLELIKTTIRPGSWDDQGGPGSAVLYPRLGDAGRKFGDLLAGVARGGGVEDDGEELVELIQTVISPDSWDINGGRGPIY